MIVAEWLNCWLSAKFFILFLLKVIYIDLIKPVLLSDFLCEFFEISICNASELHKLQYNFGNAAFRCFTWFELMTRTRISFLNPCVSKRLSYNADQIYLDGLGCCSIICFSNKQNLQIKNNNFLNAQCVPYRMPGILLRGHGVTRFNQIKAD